MATLPVFQMKLGLDENSRPGWLLADEEPDESTSFVFTIPFHPTTYPFEEVELRMAGERGGQFEEFRLTYNGRVFVEPTTGVRFALHDPFAPSDFRGLPFTNAFRYVGGRVDTIRLYGVQADALYMALAPLDLNLMDHLFVDQKLIFAGTTSAFGVHATKTSEERLAVLKTLAEQHRISIEHTTKYIDELRVERETILGQARKEFLSNSDRSLDQHAPNHSPKDEATARRPNTIS